MKIQLPDAGFGCVKWVEAGTVLHTIPAGSKILEQTITASGLCLEYENGTKLTHVKIRIDANPLVEVFECDSKNLTLGIG